jgi:hypothetical protein
MGSTFGRQKLHNLYQPIWHLLIQCFTLYVNVSILLLYPPPPPNWLHDFVSWPFVKVMILAGVQIIQNQSFIWQKFIPHGRWCSQSLLKRVFVTGYSTIEKVQWNPTWTEGRWPSPRGLGRWPTSARPRPCLGESTRKLCRFGSKSPPCWFTRSVGDKLIRETTLV